MTTNAHSPVRRRNAISTYQRSGKDDAGSAVGGMTLAQVTRATTLVLALLSLTACFVPVSMPECSDRCDPDCKGQRAFVTFGMSLLWDAVFYRPCPNKEERATEGGKETAPP